MKIKSTTADFAHIYSLIAEANLDSMLQHYGAQLPDTAKYDDKSVKVSNIIVTQAISRPPFYLPDRIDAIDKDLKDIKVQQVYHTQLFKALFDHFQVPLPPPPPAPAAP